MTTQKCIVEYVWVGGGDELRSKTRILDIDRNRNIDLLIIPDWNYDGSSTNQADGRESEIVMKPKCIFKDPFRHDIYTPKTTNIMVLCDTYTPDNKPIFNNTRYAANKLFDEKLEEEPWFGLEQEYFLIDPTTSLPLGYNETKMDTQGRFYCGVGHENAYGRTVAEEHMNHCLYAGVRLSGINAEVAPGQWEFQVGPCKGIEAGDHLLMARYILQRVGELHKVIINIEPKPLKGDWNGSGCHTNYSTKHMREGTHDKTGLQYIDEAVVKLSKKHKDHMSVYGTGNEERMTGQHETASYDIFTDGNGNRGASIRRGFDTIKNEKGYFEDRRPSSNCDPYLVTSIIFKTTCLD